MTLRKTPLITNEHYHVYNRGVDKRGIVEDQWDMQRFLKSMDFFNTVEPIGSIFEESLRMKKFGPFGPLRSKRGPLVEFVAYCVNPNHYHFLLRQVADKGISTYMQRFGAGYTKYFNEKYSRSGSLFQGTFKSIHIGSNEYLLRLSAYINLNNKVHKLPGEALVASSFREYERTEEGRCKKELVLGQFKNGSDYALFANESLEDTLHRREEERIGKLLLDL